MQFIADGTLKLLRCGTATCASPANSIIALDTIGPSGALTSLISQRVDAGGRAVVAYYDAINGDLKAVRCGAASCLP